MRVATRTFYQGVQQRILQLSDDLSNINKKVSSGKEISRPSDDPLSLIKAMGFKTDLSQVDQYARNSKVGKSWLNLSESTIDQVLGVAGRAHEIAIQMADDTQSSETRVQAAVEIGHLLGQAIALGNTQLGGSYIFSGYRTRTTPFSKVTLGGIETAQYNGDTNNFEIPIGKNDNLAVGKNGQTALMASGLFDTLGNLKKALEDNDVVNIRQALDNLKDAEDYLNYQIADVGAKANRLEGKETILSNLNITLKERLSEAEEADLAKVLTELKAKELAYQAVLMSSVKISELSMMNYMR